MCKAFSCVVTEAGEVFWKAGMDSHENIIEEFKLKKLDKEDDGLCRVEITPENDNYLMPEGKWIFNFDTPKPKWWNKKYQDSCYIELYKWQSEIYSKINMEEAKNLIHPFKIKPPKITEEHLLLLKNWASVWDSIGDYVGDSVGASVWASVWASVRASIGASVWASVRASIGDYVRASVWDSIGDYVRDYVGASIGASIRASVWDSIGDYVRASVYSYVGSLFIISNWKYCDFKYEGYPFQPCVDLWKMGLVPTYDGKIWRLHGGKDAKVLWEGKI